MWIVAVGPHMLRVVARNADVWNPAGDGLDSATAAGQQLLAVCDEVGSDANEIRWSAQVQFDGHDCSGALDELRRWYDSGFTELIVYCGGQDAIRAAEVAAEQLLPALREVR